MTLDKASLEHYSKRILIIAVPIFLSNLISQVQMLIDKIFLGKMNDLYMGAIANVTTPMWTTMSFCFSLVIGSSIIISQKVGAGNSEETEQYAAAMMKWNNVIPVLLFFFWLIFAKNVFTAMGVDSEVLPICLEYTKYFVPIFLVVGIEASSMVIMQTSNYTKPLIYFGVVRSGLNILLDWILIFGNCGFPALGIKGAAIATTIAEYVGCLYALFIFITSKKLPTRPSLSAVIKAKIGPFFTSVKLGINTAFEDFAWNFGNLMMIRILNTINKYAAGIYTIIFSVEILVLVAIGAIGNSTMTLTSEATGEKNLKQYKGVCKIAYGMCVIVSLIMFVVCLIFPQQLISLFTSDKKKIASCGIYLIFMCINLYGKSANIIVGNGIRGSGDTKWMFYSQIFGTFFVIGCAAFFVYVLKMGITGVFCAVIADELVRALINLSRLVRITKTFGEK